MPGINSVSIASPFTTLGEFGLVLVGGYGLITRSRGLGRIISEEDAVGPAMSIDTKAEFDGSPWRCWLSVVRNVFQSFL
jgi:hypothetical protein